MLGQDFIAFTVYCAFGEVLIAIVYAHAHFLPLIVLQDFYFESFLPLHVFLLELVIIYGVIFLTSSFLVHYLFLGQRPRMTLKDFLFMQKSI